MKKGRDNLTLPLFDVTPAGAWTAPVPRVSPPTGPGGPVPGATTGLEHLKLVSRAKLEILRKYLPPWAKILGSANSELCYVDCFAGPGRYVTRQGEVDGSPVIAVRTAQEYCDRSPFTSMRVILMDKDPKVIRELDGHLKPLQPYGPSLRVEVHNDDNARLVPELLSRLPANVPAFFFIDPFHYPLAIPLINQILRRPKTEVFINLMYYQIARDLNNDLVSYLVDRMFGDSNWRSQPFMKERGWKRERGFLEYFTARLGANYVLPFRIMMDDVEDNVKGDRTKYYLLHASNHPKAMLLMKDIMWPLGDEAGTFRYAARESSPLISQTPPLDDLHDALVSNFFDQDVTFDEMRVKTWDLPFIEKHYRQVIRRMIDQDLAYAIPVDSKTDKGLKGRDRVRIHMV